ncbi:MAG TPA: contact-dependent growth inhibition system immunity protein [Flavisolibacter sp.]|jgi:hypothetical protein
MNKSLEELENDYWKDIEFPSTLVERCHAYRKIPVKDLSTEQLRLLTGQKIGLRFLIPQSIAILKDNILAEGDFYPGDLLNAMLDLNDEEWSQNKAGKDEFLKLVKSKIPEIEESGDKRLTRKAKELIASGQGTT